MSICLGEARRNGANLPVTALVDQFYAEVQKMGGRRWDTSSLIARLRSLEPRFKLPATSPSSATSTPAASPSSSRASIGRIHVRDHDPPRAQIGQPRL